MSKPNILFLQTDQHRHDYLGCANPVIKTPNLDSLAQRGVRFTQGVCNSPMCVSSRYSMMTGLYSSQVGVRHNTQMIPNDKDMPVPVLAEYMQKAGYQTVGIGKTHWYIGTRIMPDVDVDGSRRGFEIRSIARGLDPLNIEPGSKYMGEDQPEWLKANGAETKEFGPGGETHTGYIGKSSQIPMEQHLESWLTEEVLSYLDNDRDPDRPFFLYHSLDFPHPGFNVPPEYEAMYAIEDFDDNPVPEPIPEGHPMHTLADRWDKMTPEEHRRGKLRYAALCTYVDDCFGKVLRKLEEIGELDNTFIFFTSDHGDMMGDRGRVSKYCLYEGSIRVPFIMTGPRVPEGIVDNRHVELVDVMPTMLEIAGQDIPDYLPGVSLLSDFKRCGSFAEMHGRGYLEYQGAPDVMYRAEKWKLILSLPDELGKNYLDYDKIFGELYDLEEDPIEMNNRYDDPDCLSIRDDLTRKALMHMMCCAGKYPAVPSRAKVRYQGPSDKPDGSMW